MIKLIVPSNMSKFESVELLRKRGIGCSFVGDITGHAILVDEGKLNEAEEILKEKSIKIARR